ICNHAPIKLCTDQLPYWKTHLLRHNLDVMHIEKNVFENVIGTVMNIDASGKAFGKSELREMSIELHRAATYYVLTNNDDSEPFIQEHKNSLVHSGVQDVDGTHRHQFANWFEKRV
ncbi:unnamed protein product, partial [Prunus brigantina]